MPECRYCDYGCDTEEAIRDHLYDDHDHDELSRIDRKRVEQYVADHGLDESDPDETDETDTIERRSKPAEQAPFRDNHRDSVLSHGRWELTEVRALSTDEIVGNLEKLGIETSEDRFRDRARDIDSAQELSNQWFEHYEVTAVGYDEDFAWMAAMVLWTRWAPDIPYAERVSDLLEDGCDLLDDGQRVEACQQWLTAWDFIEAVTPDEITSLEEAERHLPAVYSAESTLRDLEAELAAAADDDPTYHEQRLEFCRDFCERFPDSSPELLLDFRHASAESLAELDREAAHRAELGAIIEAYPDDPEAYLTLGDSYWRETSAEATGDDLERAAELYQQALERKSEQPQEVSERLNEAQQRLADADENDGA